MISRAKFEDVKHKTLLNFWGYSEFRKNQEEIIDSILYGKDTLALLPTGAGKSLCYQLPALVLEGTCLIISPLLALMKDQVSQLQQLSVEAEFISAEQEDTEIETIYKSCKDGITKILYVSPERLTNPQFLQNLEEIKLSFIAVDEAHCISEWGQDFRPSYQNIKNFRTLYKNLPCLALTATATPKVLIEIQQKLALKLPQIFQSSFRRNNIQIICEEISDKYQRILDMLKNNHSSGIIYTRTRNEAEELWKFLNDNGVKNANYFHAGLSPSEKNNKQNSWINNTTKVLIATNAFGMGINKDDVRFVIHLSPPASIENYYQEIGRAGRDEQESYAFLFWNTPELQNFDQILKNQIPTKKEFLQVISYLYSTFQIAENELSDVTYQLQIQKIKNFTQLSTPKINNILQFLHNQEIIFLNTYQSKSTIELLINHQEIDELSNKDSYFLEMLLRNLSGFSTQKIHFSEAMLCKKLDLEPRILKEKIKELVQKNYLTYIDGSMASIKFIQPRESRYFEGKWWNIFEQIQKNKIQKWEEFKFYLKNQEHCKMKMILTYFGESETKNCGNCYICTQKNQQIFGDHIAEKILQTLQKQPATFEELMVQLPMYQKEKILENLIELLDSGKIRMLNFRTYTIN